MKIQLTQQIIINNKHRYFSMLDMLCFKSKNLYNTCLYHIRQHYLNTKSYLNYYSLNRQFTSEHNFDYYNMPYAQCAQQVLKQVDKQYVSFYKALKSIKMKGKKVRLPKYKDKENGRNIVIYTNQCFRLKDNIITLRIDNEHKITFNTDKTDIQQVRIIPRGDHIVIEIIYNKKYKIKENNDRFGSIDLGLNNLATFTSNVCQSIIYDGKQLKAINHFYNKRRGELQSKLSKNSNKNNNNKYNSKRIRHITYKRNNKVKDYLHKISRMIVEYMETNNLNTLFVGKNNGWKDSLQLGKMNNQNFVSIPYNMLIQMLEYKCKLAGINFIILNEAYTSKCSFIDNEKICKHDIYIGKRISRGLFKTMNGLIVNADINGSFNIMRLGIQKCNYDVSNLIPIDMRYVYNPIRIRV